MTEYQAKRTAIARFHRHLPSAICLMENIGFGIDAVQGIIQGACVGLVLGTLAIILFALTAPCINHSLSLQLEIALVDHTIWRVLQRVDGIVDWWLIIYVSDVPVGAL